jgi:hypothetical protein
MQLNATTKKLQLTTSSAATIDVVVFYVDRDQTTGELTDGDSVVEIASATTTDIVPAPASGDTRRIKSLTIRNRHASTPCLVTVVIDVSGADTEINALNLAAGDALEYTEAAGWTPAASTTNAVASPGTRYIAHLGSQFDISSTTAAEVTGLQISIPGAGTFQFKYVLFVQAAATTTGCKMSVNYTGGVTRFACFQRWSDVSATASTAVPDQDNIGAAGHVMGSFASRAVSTAGRGVTLSVDTVNADVMFIVEGAIVASGAGDLELYFGAEVAAQTSLMVGSSVIVDQAA